MRIRPYTETDLDDLRRIHAAQGFDYAFPDLRNPLFLTKLVLLEDDPKSEQQSTCVGAQQCCAPVWPDPSGADASRTSSRSGQAPCCCPGQGIIGAAFLRLTAEAYLLLDPHAGSPRQRWEWLLHLHAAAERDAVLRGLEDVHAWLPPPLAARFGKRLLRLGWLRDDSWTPFS